MAKYTYIGGDLGEYTGKTQQLHGAVFYEVKILEGHRKGKLVVTQDGKGVPSAKPNIQQEFAFKNGQQRALNAIAERMGNAGMKVRPSPKGFGIYDGGQLLFEARTYDEAVRWMSSKHSAQQEAKDWHEDKKAFGALDARRAVRGY